MTCSVALVILAVVACVASNEEPGSVLNATTAATIINDHEKVDELNRIDPESGVNKNITNKQDIAAISIGGATLRPFPTQRTTTAGTNNIGSIPPDDYDTSTAKFDDYSMDTSTPFETTTDYTSTTADYGDYGDYTDYTTYVDSISESVVTTTDTEVRR